MRALRMIVPVVLASAFLGEAHAALLEHVSVRRERDSVWIDFAFPKGPPARFRVQQQLDKNRHPVLRVEFQPSVADSSVRGSIPGWMAVGVEADSLLSVSVAMERDVPWRSEWHGKSLRLSFLDAVRSRSIWQSPWLLAGVSAVFAGGAAYWLLAPGPASTVPDPQGGDVIPAPDIELPK